MALACDLIYWMDSGILQFSYLLHIASAISYSCVYRVRAGVCLLVVSLQIMVTFSQLY